MAIILCGASVQTWQPCTRERDHAGRCEHPDVVAPKEVPVLSSHGEHTIVRQTHRPPASGAPPPTDAMQPVAKGCPLCGKGVCKHVFARAPQPDYIKEFLETVYPGNVELVLETFNEETALRDATALIRAVHPGDAQYRSNREVVEAVEKLVARVAHLFKDAPGGPSKTESKLRKALIGHRADLHGGSTRPCSTCRESAEALGIAGMVPAQCARGDTDRNALNRLKGDETDG